MAMAEPGVEQARGPSRRTYLVAAIAAVVVAFLATTTFLIAGGDPEAEDHREFMKTVASVPNTSRNGLCQASGRSPLRVRIRN